MTPAAELVAEQIERHGPVPFSTFLELALYDPQHGFYGGGHGAAGRGGDFLTSPEVGPLFGAVLGRALDAWWDELDQPDPFVVVDVGAGRGALAVALQAAAPRCAPALHVILVERSEALRARHGEHLALCVPSQVLGAAAGPDPDAGSLGGTGPQFTSLGELPESAMTGVILANELLDNLAFDLIERTADGWAEVRVARNGDELAEVLVPAGEAQLALAERLAPDAPEGGRLPIQSEAARFLQRALGVLEAGRVVLIDYADRSPSLVNRPSREWLRTYRGHERGGDPLEAVGLQDVTCEVDIDQLARIRQPDLVRTQAELLAAHGIEELVAEGRAIWAERGHLGDLAALKGRSRVREAEALCDPAGLGAFTALEWIV